MFSIPVTGVSESEISNLGRQLYQNFYGVYSNIKPLHNYTIFNSYLVVLRNDTRFLNCQF